ncbi:hypothetical protein [Chitinivorax sp. B]|uniref:hypothetical protein n=1 Tax=Chitinivorax sp. B TaxID=2502235 RepID=UPI0010F9022F|nr:hypothetical protein [Chitinivorax sp. B]
MAARKGGEKTGFPTQSAYDQSWLLADASSRSGRSSTFQVIRFSTCRHRKETTMAKGQLRGNREPKKPKKPKQAVVPATPFITQPKTVVASKGKH